MQNINVGRLIALAIILLVVVLLSSSSFTTVNPGERGIKFNRFSGLDTEKVYDQGLHIIAPWNKLIVYDVREQIREETMSVLSSDGLNINLDVSIRFRPEQSKIGILHNQIGRKYADVIVKDLARSTVRRIIGRYKPEEIYQSKREEIELEVQTQLKASMAEKNIVLESALLRDIDLPEQIVAAIQDKLTAKQEAEKIDFQIEREKKEAERIKIQAKAKADANRILSESLTDKILREKGIEATKKLAESPNSKVIVVGSGKDGLPLILGQ